MRTNLIGNLTRRRWFRAALVATTLLAQTQAAQLVYLGTPRDYPVFVLPQEYVDLTDYNTNTTVDILAVSVLGVAVLPGLANGLFAKAKVTPVTDAYTYTSGDYNNDDVPDVAYCNQAHNAVRLLLNKWDGTFLTGATIPVSGCQQIITGQFNGDGNSDILVTTATSVITLNGHGNGTFDPPVTTGASVYRALHAVDLNEDQKGDLLYTSSAGASSNTVVFQPGLGNGAFGPPQTIYTAPPSQTVFGVNQADVDGDGHWDVVISGPGRGKAMVLKNMANGTFQPQPVMTATTQGDVTLQDLNDDGKPDLIIAGGLLSVALNNGNGTFQPARTYLAGNTSTSAGLPPSGYDLPFLPVVRVADVNRDGKVDIVAVGGNYYSAVVLLGYGNGNFRQRPAGVEVPPDPVDLATVDLNGDGYTDFVSTNRTQFGVVWGGPGGTTQVGPWVTPSLSSMTSASSGDFNGDGSPDLVLLAGGQYQVFLNHNNGTFTGLPVQTGPTQMNHAAIADLNGDGKLDMMVDASSGVQLILGNGDGTFRLSQYISTQRETTNLVLVDVNGDGRLDVAASSDRGVEILTNKGGGAFNAPVTYPTSSNSLGITAADFNGDGAVDLATMTRDNTIALFRGLGGGTFQAATYLGSNDPLYGLYMPKWIRHGDFNGDGSLDLAVLNYASGEVAVITGNGNLTFDAPQLFLLNGFVGGMTVGDYNGDGKIDIAASTTHSTSKGGVVLLTNQTPAAGVFGNRR